VPTVCGKGGEAVIFMANKPYFTAQKLKGTECGKHLGEQDCQGNAIKK